MKRPSFQFYPGDWQANGNLRRCTHEEKGVWIDIMCVLHDQEQYGVLRWPLKELSQAVGASMQKLRALISKGVLKGAEAGQRCEAYIFTPMHAGRKKGDPIVLVEAQDGPLWFSSRMVEDEYKRVIRGESSGTPKATPDHAPKGAIGAAPKPPPDPAPSRAGASSSSSSSVNTSEPNGSGAKAPMKPDEIIFSYGVPLLTNAGTDDKQARSFLGGLRKAHGDQVVVDKLRECMRARPLQPLEWLAAALPPSGARVGRQSALESRNAQVAQDWKPPELREATQ